MRYAWYRVVTARAGMSRATGFDLTRADAEQMALVLEHTPQLPSHGRVVAPVAKAPPHTTASPFGSERGQVFPTDQSAIIQERQQNQQIRGQMGELTVAPFIRSPAGLDARLPALANRGNERAGEGAAPR
jgi:hypothetical protein